MLLLMEGFENREPKGAGPVSYTANTTDYPIQFVAGKTGGYAITSDFEQRAQLIVPPAAVACVSAAIKIVPGNYTGNQRVLEIRNADANWQCPTVEVSNTGSIQVNTTSGNFVAPDYLFPMNAYVRLELRISMANQNAGWFELWCNGVMVLKKTGINTIYDYSGGGNITRYVIFDLGHGYNWNNPWRLYLDDVYITDTTGPAPYNGRLGDVRILMATPKGDGTSVNLVGSDGNSVDNYQLIDEVPSSEVDYVTATNPGDGGFFDMDTVPYVGDILAVQSRALAKIIDSGNTGFKFKAKNGANTVVDTKVGLSVNSSWVYGSAMTTAPDGTAWTNTKLDATDFGFEIE